tara:strand:+ start:305 stop:1804 length:1500 start_codon:yes stop_codon:yes gene_type:complete
MNIINNIIATIIKNRIKSINTSIKNPIENQNNILKSNIKYAKKTMFGKDHNFEKILCYQDFKNLVPIRSYEEMLPYIQIAQKHQKNILWPGKMKWFAKSSGTTQNKSKYIPVTSQALYDNHFKAGKDMLALYLEKNPTSKILNGKSLMIGGSTSIQASQGFYAGDISAIIIKNLPLWVQSKRLPSIKNALLDDWEKKINKIIKECQNANIVSISGVPSWTIIIINKLLSRQKKQNLSEIWPNLELYLHGGVSFENYKNTFNNFCTKKINYIETYNASEGFFGIQNEPNKSDLLLLIDHGIFYEFIPIENGLEIQEKTISLKDVELNTCYALIISSNGGLWRYKIGDTIKFTSTHPYKIKITGRIQSFINAFGEELNVENANQAVKFACIQTESSVNEFIAAPYFFTNKTGCHEWVIEFHKKPNSIREFKYYLDKKLKELNSDYEAKRFKNILIKEPILHIAKTNFFYHILKTKNKIGGQNKIKRLYNDRNFIEFLLKNL